MAWSRRQFATSVLAPVLPLPERHPRLLLLVVVEQMRPDYLLRLRPGFVGGGFNRLLEAGAVFLDCRHQAATFPAATLATLGAGAYPAVHGIVANRWYDPARRMSVEAAASQLRATTFAGEARRAGGRVYAVAPTVSRAALLAGDALVRTFAFDSRGHLAPTPYEPGELSWLAAFQNAHDPDQVRDARWVALGAPPEAAPLRVLRFDATRPEDFYLLFQASPFAQAAQFDLLRELIEKERLAQGDTLDIIIMVVGTTALLGHETGAQSPLMQQLILHLDRNLAASFDYLDSMVGAGQYLVAVTGAHGAATLAVERREVSGESLAQAIDKTLGGGAVERYLYPFLYLRPGPRSREGRLAAARAAMRFPGVAGYYTLDGDCSHHGAWKRRMENSFHAGRSGDLMLVYGPEYMEGFRGAPAISYGSIYNYDVQAPLLLYGPPFRARLVERTIEAVDLTPTLARACNLPLPSSSTGRVLHEAFARAARARDRK
jgi:hypothetical protein